MKFLSTVFLLAGTVSAVLIALFIGHALASHNTSYVVAAVGAAVVAAVCYVVYSRLAGRAESEGSHP
jgi:hypothetical protein